LDPKAQSCVPLLRVTGIPSLPAVVRNKRVFHAALLAGLVVSTLGLILEVSGNGAAHDISIPQQLQAAIKVVHRNARVITRSDVDWTSCGSPEADQIITADMNGDGRLDYAALLRLPTKTTAQGERENGTAGAVWLVVFVGRPDGSYKPIVLDRHGDRSAGLVDITIALRLPGVVKEIRSGRKITLTLPGIERLWCERSGTVFFWSKKAGRFESLWTGD